MKCYALMIHDDGSAMVGECPPKMGEEMMAAGAMESVASVDEGMSRLGEMAGSTEERDEGMAEGFRGAFGPGEAPAKKPPMRGMVGA